ncbi:hypothetical protein ABB37_00794 [Leptomonas pyrrhocoris]|uniref:Uncharacterized protein n=1 Tax=Leptomonas pyrrhocoris TaxID=157538 RepID=A0A0M9GB33_LEPPY|nr:hypothetical protein ABB37_00794 [Leptomonas pyrrhocoris]KPA86700.1 hypothetical protein ABB37_00794 [Leptomonas pyrrhocoris]|eukprot:XP_015665139.1 hypothetical protein ABB37_00794 [Leptomonas pyrrhocoris]
MSLPSPSPDPASSGQLPTQQTLADRIRQNQEEQRRCVGARRHVGLTVPTEAEVAAILSARTTAATRDHQDELEDDVERTGVTALRCYDVSLDEAADDVFQAPPHLSDVQVRQDLARPLNKLMAIFALRLRLASVLETVMSARDGKQARLGNTKSDELREGEGSHFPLPSASALPQLSTLLRELPLPDIVSHTLCSYDAGEHASAQLFDVPRSRPLHEPFVFRLRHFTTVGMPSFALDIAAQADKETKGGTVDSLSLGAAQVPAMDVPQPSSSPSAAALLGSGVDAVKSAGGLTSSLTRVASEARSARHPRETPADNTGGADAETFPAVLPSNARAGCATGLMHPQGM